MTLHKFELSSWIILSPQVDSDEDDLRDVSEGLADWMYSVGDGTEVSLRYGALDDDLEVVEPEIDFYSPDTSEPFDIDAPDSIDESAEDFNTSVRPIGYYELFGNIHLQFRFGLEVFISVEADSLQEAKNLVKENVESSFYFVSMDENQEIDYIEVRSIADNEVVFASSGLPEACQSCQYKIRRGGDACENCGGTVFERFI